MGNVPIMLNVQNRRCMIIGGGSVALRRAKSLLEAGAVVTVVAPQIKDELAQLALKTIPRPYQQGDLQGAFMVVLATDDRKVNDAASQEAKAQQVLINRADQPDDGDLTLLAHQRCGPMTIAVDSGRTSPKASGEICRQLAAALDESWPQLLRIVGQQRQRILDNFPDSKARRQCLKELANPAMIKLLKERGGNEVIKRCHELTQNL